MSVDMDVVGVMAAYLPAVRVCTPQSRETLPPSNVLTCATKVLCTQKMGIDINQLCKLTTNSLEIMEQFL